MRTDSARLRALIPALALALLGAATPGLAAEDGHDWKTYSNDRFGFSVCYPADLVQPQAAPDNADGRTFTASNGAKIAAWGSLNAMDWTLADSARQVKSASPAGRGRSPTRSFAKASNVISGRKGGQIFYNRTALANGKFSAVEMTYPAADSALWNPISARVSRCFKPA